MKKRFAGIIIGLGLTLILLGNFTTLSLAQTVQEQCDAYEVHAKNNDMLIENVFFALMIRYNDTTGQLIVDFDENLQQFELIEGKRSVELTDPFCSVKILAKNFKKIDGTDKEYTVKSDEKPVKFVYSLQSARGKIIYREPSQ